MYLTLDKTGFERYDTDPAEVGAVITTYTRKSIHSVLHIFKDYSLNEALWSSFFKKPKKTILVGGKSIIVLLGS